MSDPLDIEKMLKKYASNKDTIDSINSLSSLNAINILSVKSLDYIHEVVMSPAGDYGVLNTVALCIAVLKQDNSFSKLEALVSDYYSNIKLATAKYTSKDVSNLFIYENIKNMDDIVKFIAYLAILDIKIK